MDNNQQTNASIQKQLQAMASQIDNLSQQVRLLEDHNEIRRLHHKYGYYLDKCLYDEVIDLLSKDSEVYFLNGIYKGKEGARRLYCGWFRDKFAEGTNGPSYGSLLEHMIAQDIVTVAPDGKTARGRFRCFMQGGTHEQSPVEEVPQFWEGGIYENTYVKENGVWKIQILNYNAFFNASFSEGWRNTRTAYAEPMLNTLYPDDPQGPDALRNSEDVVLWPDTRVIPFHYPHPVTQKPFD
ncbi:nuclear transport factor 2 family protein [Halomonas sp. WWR20]